MNPTDKIELKHVDLSVLENMITELQEIIVPEFEHITGAFLEYDEEHAQHHMRFFALFFLLDETHAADLLRNLEDSARAEIAIQLANARLFCKIARDRGWNRLVIPTDIPLFLSVVPKAFLLAVNEERISKGLSSSKPGYISLEIVPAKDESN